MIPQEHIREWRAQAPWPRDEQVEQDLIISRALVEIFSVPELASKLAFRGGTALFKLAMLPAGRYSEDIDLVQIRGEPIGPTLRSIRTVLDPWLGDCKSKTKEGRVNLIYHFDTETARGRRRLKIEINSREHFTEHGHLSRHLEVVSGWWSGSADITSFTLEELLGTKLRALYQRKKGRDLFDLATGLERGAVPHQIISCFMRYMRESGHHVTRAQFEKNLSEKLSDPVFMLDTDPILRQGVVWDAKKSAPVVLRELIAKLPGDPWAGSKPPAKR